MKTLVGFGASSMEGVGDSQGGFLKRVALHCQSHALPLTVINKGIGGQSTPDMLARIDELAPLRPYELVVILGCNDLPRSRDQSPAIRTAPDAYAANLHRIFSTIKSGRSLLSAPSRFRRNARAYHPPGLRTTWAPQPPSPGHTVMISVICSMKPRAAQNCGLPTMACTSTTPGHAFIANRVLEWLGPGLPRADK